MGIHVNIEGVLGEDELAELNTLIDEQDYPDLVDDNAHTQRFDGFPDFLLGDCCIS